MEKDDEQFEQAETAQEKLSPLHTVTPLSKYLAMGLFIILPFLGGLIGYTYAPEKIVVVEKTVTIKNEEDSKSRDSLNTKVDHGVGSFKRLAAGLISPSGNSVSVSSNRDDRSPIDCEGYTWQEVVGDVAAPSPERITCEATIKTQTERYTFTNFEMQQLGGLPFQWVDGENFSVYSLQAINAAALYGSAGLFNVSTQTYEEVLTFEHPLGYCCRIFINHKNGRYLAISANNDSYNLYLITSSRRFDEFFSFLETQSLFSKENPDNSESPMMKSLIPEALDELELIGQFSRPDNNLHNITVDKDENVIFSFGNPNLNTSTTKHYLFNISAGTIEQIELKSGM